MNDDITNLPGSFQESVNDFPIKLGFKADEDTSMLPKGVVVDEIIIHPLKVATVERIYPFYSKIEKEDLQSIVVKEDQDKDPDELTSEVIEKYKDVIVEIICLGIHNHSSPYPEYMPEFLKANCPWEDLHFMFNSVLYRMGTRSFVRCVSLLMRVGPGAAEMIALQKNLESWKQNNQN